MRHASGFHRNLPFVKQEIAAVKEDAEQDLALAASSRCSTGGLELHFLKDINSLKALKSPPDIVKRIFDCVLLLR